MNHPVSRRTLMRWSALVPLASLAGCTAGTGTSTSDVPSPAWPSAGTQATLPEGIGDRPLGPDGTHWPDDTPRPSSELPTIEVDCRWDGIAAALARVDAAQAAAGLQIVVKPGTLSDNRGRVLLEDVGSTDWERKVLVTPRDGWGSVTMVGQTRLRAVHGVTFARFNADFVGLIDCSQTNWAQSRLSQGLGVYSERSDTAQCNIYEAVMPSMKVDVQDPFAYVAAEGTSLSDSTWSGCYSAPIYRPLGSDSHLDTFQMYGKGFYRGLTLKDTVLFGSHNSGLQLGGTHANDPNLATPFATIDSCLLVSQLVANRTRYPAPVGAEQPPRDQVINGSGEPEQLFASNSVVLGTMYNTQWGAVSNSYTSSSRAPEVNESREGSWIYSAHLDGFPNELIDALSMNPSDEFLAAIWR